MSNVPNSLPEDLDELALLMRTCIELGFQIAYDNHEPRSSRPWFHARQELRRVIDETVAPKEG